jgi:hypothetical protein
LKEPLATELAAFRAALGGGNTEIGVVRDAVRAYIRARREADKALDQQYRDELAKLTRRQPIRLVTKTED